MATESSLRALAKGYASGQLDKSKYRNDRAAFIEGVLSGSIRIRQNPSTSGQASLSSESRVSNPADKTTLMGSGIAPPSDKSASREIPVTKSRVGMLVAAAGAVLVIITVIVMMTGDEHIEQADTTAAGNQVQVAATPSAAVGLVRSFLDTNSWAQSSIDNFIAEWNLLAETEKSALVGSIELGQLTNAIYKKLLEERALSGIGNPETSYEKQRVLVEFAANLGINDQRISLPEQPAPATP